MKKDILGILASVATLLICAFIFIFFSQKEYDNEENILDGLVCVILISIIFLVINIKKVYKKRKLKLKINFSWLSIPEFENVEWSEVESFLISKDKIVIFLRNQKTLSIQFARYSKPSNDILLAFRYFTDFNGIKLRK